MIAMMDRKKLVLLFDVLRELKLHRSSMMLVLDNDVFEAFVPQAWVEMYDDDTNILILYIPWDQWT